MPQNVNYEWDVETLDITDPKDPQVLDHHHEDTLKGLFRQGRLVIDPEHALCLVRTDHSQGGGREWCYITQESGMPPFFRDAYEKPGSTVPKKYLAEYARLKDKISFTGAFPVLTIDESTPTPPAE